MNEIVRKLFSPPFSISSTEIRDFKYQQVVSLGFPVSCPDPVPRGWGRIQYLPDGEKKMDLWEEFFWELVRDETDGQKIVNLLNESWSKK